MRLGGEADDLDAAVLRFGEGDGLDVIHPLNLGADQHHRACLAKAQVVVKRPMRLEVRGEGRAVVLTQIGLLEAKDVAAAEQPVDMIELSLPPCRPFGVMCVLRE